ncbi:MAG: DNA-protecting protein DprA [Chloroflexi bacterium]|nr:DNA-protecting protein DprA [Chloroflexota bacterium]
MRADELKYWVAFNRIPGLGRAKFLLLEKHFGHLSQAWVASPAALKAGGLDEKTVAAIVETRAGISPDAEMEQLAKLGVRALTWHDDAYPRRLKEIYDPPPVLYLRGALTAQDDWAITVVGTRRCTAYGKEAAEQIAGDLARNRITIVSGLARGIDTIAHQAALGAGGRTIAVTAGGLDTVYPPENVRLAQQTIERGALLSEHPPGVKPLASFFPRRNRIMSGISMGTLVVEGDDGSGALITANLALEQDREVFAVPGSVFSPASRGTNRLIQEGAKLVLDATDILEELNLTVAAHQMELRETLQPDDKERDLLKYLSSEPTHIDQVRRLSGQPMAQVSSALAMLEIKGLVRQVGAMNYVLAREAQARYGVKVE